MWKTVVVIALIAGLVVAMSGGPHSKEKMVSNSYVKVASVTLESKPVVKSEKEIGPGMVQRWISYESIAHIKLHNSGEFGYCKYELLDTSGQVKETSQEISLEANGETEISFKMPISKIRVYSYQGAQWVLTEERFITLFYVK